MISRCQFSNYPVDRLLLGVQNLPPTLDVALLDNVEEVTDVASAHDDFSLAIPLGFETVY